MKDREEGKMKRMFLFAAFLSAAMFVAAPLPAQQKKPAPPPQKKAPPKPNRGQIISRLKKENPFRQAKVGDNVAFPLLSKAVVKGKVAGITEKGVWIQDGAFKFLQKREVMSLEGRAKFYKPDYEKYINSLADDEIREMTGVKFTGNTNSVAKSNDPRFKKPTKAPSTSLGAGKTNLSLKKQ